jgi:hypothetical protein
VLRYDLYRFSIVALYTADGQFFAVSLNRMPTDAHSEHMCGWNNSGLVRMPVVYLAADLFSGILTSC